MSVININVQVNSTTANSRLQQLHQQVKKVGSATKQTKNHFKDFNQTMFGATAFVGMFAQAFQGLARTMMDGSELDRATKQFSKRFANELPASIKKFDDGTEIVIGPQGRFIQNIRAMTTNSIDMMAAMKAAIQLRSAGVTGDIDSLSEIVVRAGTAAKIAGKDSAEGIRRVTDFLKDGSLAHLQHLGLLREVNPELKAQLAVLGKASGVLSTAVTGTYKLALGMKILREATKGQLKGQRDLRDTLQDTAQFFDHLRRTVGTFLGTAMQPILESFIDFSLNARIILEDIIANKKEIVFLAKAFIIGTAAVSGFVLVVGGLRLAIKALTSLIGGIPFLTLALTALGAAILYNKTSMTGLVDTLRTFGAVAQGSFQLIHSFISDPENFAAGIGKMDKSIHDLLKRKGLLGLVQNIARVGSIITIFVKGAYKGFVAAFSGMLEVLGPVGQGIKNILGIDSGAWSRDWLENAKKLGEVFGKLSFGILGVVGAMKLLKLGKGLMSGVSGIFKFGGIGGSNAPKGTKSDPLHVINVSDMIGSAGSAISSKLRLPGRIRLGRSRFGKDVRAGKRFWRGAGATAVNAPSKVMNFLKSLYSKKELSQSKALTNTIKQTFFKGGIIKGTLRGLGARGAAKAYSRAGIRGLAMATAPRGVRNFVHMLGRGSSTLGIAFGKLRVILAPIINLLVTKFGPAIASIGRVALSFGKFTMIGAIVGTLATAFVGFIEGLVETKDKISDFATAVTNWVTDMFETNSTLKAIKEGFNWVVDGIKDIFNKIKDIGKGMGIAVGEAFGAKAREMHTVMFNKRHLEANKLIDSGGVSAMSATVDKKTGKITMPESEGMTQAQKVATIIQSIKSVEGEKKENMQKAFMDAMELRSKSGVDITREEWVDIYAAGLDKSKKIEKLSKDANDTKNNTGDGIIGSAREGAC